MEIPPLLPPDPDRFGGWLLLPMMGLILSPFLIGHNIMDGVQLLNNPKVEILEQVYPGFKFVLASEISANVSLLVFGVYVLVAFLRKKSIVPLLMIFLLGIRFIVILSDVAATDHVFQGNIFAASFEGISHIIGYGLAAAIWIPYFLKSDRVALTFTRP